MWRAAYAFGRVGAPCALGAGAGVMMVNKLNGPLELKAKTQEKVISLEELKKHDDMKSLWMSYRGNVYDVTEFMFGHPGGTDRLLMAGGKDVEPFWDVYTEHYRGHVVPFMDRFKVGVLSNTDATKARDFTFGNPFADDPIRHPDLLHCTTHPFNGEPRIQRLTEQYFTPNELHYVRNHLPVPDIDDDDWELEVSGVGVKKPKTFTLKDIKNKFKKYEVVNTYQCAGNRREDFHGNVDGDQQIFISPHWIVGAFSCAKWGGARMRDVLIHCGVDMDAMALGKIDPHDLGIKDAQFEGYDKTESGIYYGASIPIDKVIDPFGDVLVAYEMNGEPLPYDHGKPARVMIPGYAGCRSVKWVNKLILASKMSGKPWQDKSYLHFPPDCRFENDPIKMPGKALWKWTNDPVMKQYLDDKDTFRYGRMNAIVAYIQPTTSIICNPPQATVICGSPDSIEIKGCAHSFGGAGIHRVDVSTDGGRNWTEAPLFKPEYLRKHERVGAAWGWVQFTKDVPLSPDQKAQLASGRQLHLELVSKALNSHWDAQPEYPDSYFNARGVCIGHQYRVPVVIDPNVERGERDHAKSQLMRNNYYKPDPKVTPQARTGQEFPNKPTGGMFKAPWVHDIKDLH